MWIFPHETQLAIQGRENLSHYAFGDRVWRKQFCKTCGVQVAADLNPLTDDEIAALPLEVRDQRAREASYRPLNLRVFDGVDLKRVKPARVDGWARGKPYVNP